MQETADDLTELQALMDRTYARAGPHLLSVVTPEHRMSVSQLADRLTGMVLLVLATSTADGRPLAGPVDGVFFRGAFHFGSAADSVRIRHIRARPAVSASHLPAEHLAVTVHGRARLVDPGDPAQRQFRGVLSDIYGAQAGPEWEAFMAASVYARIEADRLYAFAMAPT